MSDQILRTTNTNWKVLLILISIMLIIISLWQLVLDGSFSKEWPIKVSITFIFWAVLYLFVTYRHFKSIYLFTTAYVVSLAIFHLGHVISHAFGWDYYSYFEIGSMAVWMEKAGWSNLLSLGSIGLGFGVSFNRMLVKFDSKKSITPEIENNLAATFWIGVGLTGASFVAILITIATVGNVFQYSRTEIFGGVGDTRGLGFFLMVVPSAMVLLTVGAVKKKEKWIAYPLTALVMLLLLMSGYRSSAMFSALIGAIVWVKVGKNIPVIIAPLLILFVLVAIPTARYLRDLGTIQDVSKEKIMESYQATDAKEVIKEIGGTSYIVANVLKWIPAHEPFRYGRSYLWAVETMVPNIGFSIGQGRDAFKRIGKGNRKELHNGNPADWYIYKTNRWKYDRGLGAGFSTIAEPYLNFGYPGIIVYFVVLGYLLGKLDHKDLRVHPKLLIFSGAMLWPLIKTVRNSFVVFLKPLGLLIVAIIIWRIMTFWKRRYSSTSK